MFHIVLYEPEIPPNTGNIIRLCANTGTQLHLIHPLGFEMDDRLLKRAGLDYHEYTNIRDHISYRDFITAVQPKRLFALSTKGTCDYTDIQYQAGDTFIFGPETRGLPVSVMADQCCQQVLRIPMQEHNRSLNLSNTVAIVVYEALRQNNFHFE